jgi:hypothetical protein
MDNQENTKNKVADWRKSKKARMYIIVGLLVLVAVVAFLFESLRWWMLGVGVALLVALGLETTNTDIDLGTLIDTGSLSDSKIERDADGNLSSSEDGGLLTRVLRDMEGNEVPKGTAGAKYADEYNCDDFATQQESQRFFDNAGGLSNDVNRLDGNKDGVACQALPSE